MIEIDNAIVSEMEDGVPFAESFARSRLNADVKTAFATRTMRDEEAPAYSDEFLVKCVALRGITLLEIGLSNLAGRFSCEEMTCLLSAHPVETWSTRAGHLIARKFAEAYGLENAGASDVAVADVMLRTHAKLRALAPLEAMALTDFCERWWQSTGALCRASEDFLRLSDQCEWLGLKLID